MSGGTCFQSKKQTKFCYGFVFFKKKFQVQLPKDMGTGSKKLKIQVTCLLKIAEI